MRTTILLLIIYYLLIGSCYAEKIYTTEDIVDSIWLIEGGLKTNYPFGIRSITCQGYDECRQICWNTVEKNKVRYAEYGHKKYKTFTSFLSSRYCPISIPGCENWEKNLLFYLNKEK